MDVDGHFPKHHMPKKNGGGSQQSRSLHVVKRPATALDLDGALSPWALMIREQYLVGGFTPLKHISQIGSSSQLLGEIKIMFQTTNQY